MCPNDDKATTYTDKKQLITGQEAGAAKKFPGVGSISYLKASFVWLVYVQNSVFINF